MMLGVAMHNNEGFRRASGKIILALLSATHSVFLIATP
jgi:hypothetical protein